MWYLILGKPCTETIFFSYSIKAWWKLSVYQLKHLEETLQNLHVSMGTYTWEHDLLMSL